VAALLEAGFKLFIHLDIIYTKASIYAAATYTLLPHLSRHSSHGPVNCPHPATSRDTPSRCWSRLLRYIIMRSIGELEKRVEGLTDEINDIFHATALNLSALGVQL
jgi:hypothetical protein